MLPGMGMASAARAAVAPAADAQKKIRAAIDRQLPENIARIQDWIKTSRNRRRKLADGRSLRLHHGYDQGRRLPDGQAHADQGPARHLCPRSDAGAKRTVGIYFMYDVKQVNPAEWSSPPFEARITNKPGWGQVIVGRGAINQKGPEAAFLAALHAFREAGQKLPVNLVLVAEGEEEIASPNFHQIVQAPEVLAALKKCEGIVIPTAWQSANGSTVINLGAKGPIEFQLIASGERWARARRSTSIPASTRTWIRPCGTWCRH